MPLSTSEHEAIQHTVELASKEEKDSLKTESEAVLLYMSSQANRGLLTREEAKAMESAIETLVRIEATEQSKGWLFRAKRRVQLTHMYLKSD